MFGVSVKSADCFTAPYVGCYMSITSFSTTATTLTSAVAASGTIQSSGGPDWCNDGSDFILVPGDDNAYPVTTASIWKIINGTGTTVSQGGFTLVQTQQGQNGHYCPPSTTPMAYQYAYSPISVNISALPAGTYTFKVTDGDGDFDTRTFVRAASTGTITVAANNVSSTWTFPSSAGNPCGTCSGTAQTYTTQTAGAYTFSPSSIYANSKVSTSSASGGSTCSSGTQCTLAGAGQINFTATYTPTTCTVRVQGIINPATQAATGQTFQISGPPGITNGTNSTGLQTYTLQSDAAGSAYTLTATSHNNLVTVGGYVSDYNGVDGSGNPAVYSDSQTCFPGGTITFTINYITKPILNVQ